MRKYSFIKTCLVAGIFSLSFIVTGCSDDDKPKETISHELLNAEVSDEDKQNFEERFEHQCIERESKNAANPEDAAAQATPPCRCIAKFMMKDLTAIEAEKYLEEHQDAHSLRIKYENAAYHCLQQNAHPKGPNFSKPQ